MVALPCREVGEGWSKRTDEWSKRPINGRRVRGEKMNEGGKGTGKVGGHKIVVSYSVFDERRENPYLTSTQYKVTYNS